MIEVVVFDLDDTLYPEKDYVRSGFKYLSSIIEDEYQQAGFFEIAWTKFESGNRSNIFNSTLDEMGITYTKQQIKSYVDLYRSHDPDISLPKESLEILKYFHQSKKIGLITDGYHLAQRKKIKSLSLEPYMDKIIVTDELGQEYWKPSPVPYSMIEDYFSVQGKNCAYIGDNTNKDFVTANKKGWMTIQLIRENKIHPDSSAPEDQATHTIKNLSKLKVLLRKPN